MDWPGHERAGWQNMTEDQDRIVEKYRGACICGACPTYNECMRADEQLLFCVIGRAEHCTFDKKGCICPNCPVTKDLGWKKAYYCVKGSEKDQH